MMGMVFSCIGVALTYPRARTPSMILGLRLKLSKLTVFGEASGLWGMAGISCRARGDCFMGVWVTILGSLFLCWRPSWVVAGFWFERPGAWKPLCCAGDLCGAGALCGVEAFWGTEAFCGGEALYGHEALGGVAFSGTTGDAPVCDTADEGSAELPFKWLGRPFLLLVRARVIQCLMFNLLKSKKIALT
jgi:hypothetical protein